jgi:predicted DCC family thiol-disulfide oxidoreductase YuxK
MPVLYDRDCGFCRFSIGLLLAWDRRRALRPVAIQSKEGQALLAELPPAERLASAHVVEVDGRLRSGGAVAAPVLRLLPVGGPLARLAERSPRLADRCYRTVANSRGTLGRLLPARAKRWADSAIERRTRVLAHP